MASGADCRPAAGTALLGVFARYWLPGHVKSRLAARTGADSAARLHRHFVASTLARLGEISPQKWLVVSPGESIPHFVKECPEAATWQLSGQNGENLGQRIGDFFARALACADRVVLVGSDSPDLPKDLVERAFAKLGQVPVVLGPALDGGYYLIGLAAQQCDAPLRKTLFDAIPWGSPRVLAETEQRLKTAGIGYHLLPVWRDVDEWDDLLALHQRLTTSCVAPNNPLSALVAAVEFEMARAQIGTASELH